MSIFFNALHSPIGAHSSFTLGCKGKSGGLGLELGGPACENIYIGLQSYDSNYRFLPFFDNGEDESLRYDHDKEVTQQDSLISFYNDSEIKRDFKVGSDTFSTDEITLKILSAPIVAPDPEKACDKEQMLAYCPSILIELTINNKNCDRSRNAIFGYSPENNSDSLNIIENLPLGYTGIAKGRNTAIISDSPLATPAQGFSLEAILKEEFLENYNFGLGNTGLLIFKIPPSQEIKCRIALCFFRDGVVTTGKDTSYWYTKFFKDINSVGIYSLENFGLYTDLTESIDKEFELATLNESQKFHLAHSIKSYFGSTQLLNWDEKPFWVVNEGEYRMMNTFDLTVDQLFFELRQNPWTVKNELDMFTKRYSYTDKLHFPGGKNMYPGGISFTHDMGMGNHISRASYSTYEKFGLTGCFSHMTCEQLVNWVLCGALYYYDTKDRVWLANNLRIFNECLESMVNRDHPDKDSRNGRMGLDSSRTLNGAEITTYDSLDESLGQGRNNVYLAVKSWAAYLALGEILKGENKLLALNQAKKASSTICSFLNSKNFIPAIMGEKCDSKIIPAIEGLIFPYYLGYNVNDPNWEYNNLVNTLKIHFNTVLVKNECLYNDDGWKLSSSADNSWLSKIYLCQFVAREILNVKTPETGLKADIAHRNWLLKDENLFFAWSDQMKSGVAHGSKYYPRGVTSILWLRESV